MFFKKKKEEKKEIEKKHIMTLKKYDEIKIVAYGVLSKGSKGACSFKGVHLRGKEENKYEISKFVLDKDSRQSGILIEDAKHDENDKLCSISIDTFKLQNLTEKLFMYLCVMVDKYKVLNCKSFSDFDSIYFRIYDSLNNKLLETVKLSDIADINLDYRFMEAFVLERVDENTYDLSLTGKGLNLVSISEVVKV